MGPRALTASSGFAPWSMAVDRTSAALKKNPAAHGGSRGLAPLGCLPHWGREGVTLGIVHASSKNARGFLQSPFFGYPEFRREVHNRDDNKKRIDLFIEVSADKKYPAPIQVRLHFIQAPQRRDNRTFLLAPL